MITERESGLIYSGESGGLNESGTGVGDYTQMILGGDTPEASGPMKESMETMKKAWKDASSTPEGRASSEPGDTGVVDLLGTSDALAPSDFFLV